MAEASTALLASSDWRVVSSLFAPETEPVSSPAHRRWLRSHTDRHPQREALLALGGESLQSHNGLLYPCGPGSLFLFDRGESHDLQYAPQADGLTHLWLGFLHGSVVGRVLCVRRGEILRERKATLVLHDRELGAVIERRWSELARREGAAPLKRQFIVSAFATLVFSMLWAPPEPETAESHPARVVRAMERHIEVSAGRDVNLEGLARMAGYSVCHFARLFKRVAGKTVHQFVDEVRLRRYRRLRDEGYLMKQISEELGFSCPAAFSRWLRRYRAVPEVRSTE